MLNQKLTGQQAADKTYIEDVFSTYLYTGNGSTQTITNGIDLAGKGGMTWIKSRSAATSNQVFDTTRDGRLFTDSTSAQGSGYVPTYFNFNSDGFYLDAGGGSGYNTSTATYASWAFAKSAKFFDVVTYTGDGSADRGIAHGLNSVPGMIFVKATSTTSNWYAVTGDSNTTYLIGDNNTGVAPYALNSTGYAQTQVAKSDIATSTTFNVAKIVDNVSGAGFDSTKTNANGVSYVAYLFAHDTTTDGLIRCGSFSGATTVDVNLGWEPQYVLFKNASDGGSWYIADVMRGMSNTRMYPLQANTSDAEFDLGGSGIIPTATGFTFKGANFGYTSGQNIIYMAIRRGPMRTPTDATKVFNPVLAATGAPAYRSSNFTSGIDSALTFYKPGYDDGLYAYPNWNIRLTGTGQLQTPNTRAEIQVGNNTWDYMNGYDNNAGLSTQWGSWLFKRAPGFFDVVCYTGNGSTSQNIAHNLGIAPELLIVKSRSQARLWAVYNSTLGATQGMRLNGTDASFTTGYWNDTTPTSTVFTVGNTANTNGASENYVAYLFASCPGVSKVGSYTGNGSSQTINCGFTNGARFVMIKRTDSTGDWFVWDTARGIVAGNDPHLSLNTTTAEVTTNDTIDPDSTGFIVNQVAATNVNVSGGSYIYLAIA